MDLDDEELKATKNLNCNKLKFEIKKSNRKEVKEND